MSELTSDPIALPRRAIPVEDPRSIVARGYTDCDFAWFSATTDTIAMPRMVRAVCHGMPTDEATLAPHLQSAPDRLRYIIDGAALDTAALHHLHDRGARAIRHRLPNPTQADDWIVALHADADRLAPLGWHIELAVGEDLSALATFEWELLQLPVALCLTDISAAVERLGVADEGVGLLLDLLHMGRTWIKLGGAIRYEALRGFVNAALAVRSDRLLWGSGGGAPTRLPADHAGQIASRLAVLERLIPDEDDRAAVLVENPARLYGFEG